MGVEVFQFLANKSFFVIMVKSWPIFAIFQLRGPFFQKDETALHQESNPLRDFLSFCNGIKTPFVSPVGISRMGREKRLASERISSRNPPQNPPFSSPSVSISATTALDNLSFPIHLNYNQPNKNNSLGLQQSNPPQEFVSF